MTRLHWPSLFTLTAARIDWAEEAKRMAATMPPSVLLKPRGIGTRNVHLRWVVHPQLGMAGGPFQVWTAPQRTLYPLMTSRDAIVEQGPGYNVIDTPDNTVAVELIVSASAEGGISAFAGAPWTSDLVDVAAVPPGDSVVTLSGAQIGCLVLGQTISVSGLKTLSSGALLDPKLWTPAERVGFPADDWGGIFDFGQGQGLAGQLAKPSDAALDRYRRAAPAYGWPDTFAPGVPAPHWIAADPGKLLTAMKPLLAELKPIVQMPGLDQAGVVVTDTMTVDGMADEAKMEASPLDLLTIAVMTDPQFAILAGFGTAYADTGDYAPHASMATVIGNPLSYMVTARFPNLFPGYGFELASFAYRASASLPPGPPTGLTAITDGYTAPDTPGAPYQAITRLLFDKWPDTSMLRIASAAAMRQSVSPAGGVTPLMRRRENDLAWQPIGGGANPEVNGNKISVLDDGYQVQSVPSDNVLGYAVSQQDVYGRWSNWAGVFQTVREPAVQTAEVVWATFAVDPAGADPAPCAATLTMEIAWNWRTRAPDRIDVFGALFDQPVANAPAPAGLALPTGFQQAGGSGAGPLTLTFTGDAASAPGATIGYLSPDGKAVMDAPQVPTGIQGIRRYRVTVPGFSLNFAPTGHVGLALWAIGTERTPAQRKGKPQATPRVASASDPRPPIMSAPKGTVQLASLPDAHGDHHASLSWQKAGSAVGYHVYQATEQQLRDRWGKGPIPLDQTLTERLGDLRAWFAASPDRTPFTRITSAPVEALGYRATLPRGTREIWLHIVLGVGPGGVESLWPVAGDAAGKMPSAHAAPILLTPDAPTIEARRMKTLADGFATEVTLRLNPSPAPIRVDLFQTLIPAAATDVDLMGPPVASFTLDAPGAWKVVPAEEAITATAMFHPLGSWQPRYFRAVAWSGDDAERGMIGGRSRGSVAASIVVPPEDPPPLTPLAADPLGSGLYQFTATTTAPIATTLLGDHAVSLVLFEQTGGTMTQLYPPPMEAGTWHVPEGVGLTLASLPTAQPSGTATAMWIEAGGKGEPHRLCLRAMHAPDRALVVRLRLSDPLGRSSEQVYTLAASVTKSLKIGVVQGGGEAGGAVNLLALDVEGASAAQLAIAFDPPVLPPFVLPVAQLEQGIVTPRQAYGGLAVRREIVEADRVRLHIGLPNRPARMTISLSTPDGETVVTTKELG